MKKNNLRYAAVLSVSLALLAILLSPTTPARADTAPNLEERVRKLEGIQLAQTLQDSSKGLGLDLGINSPTSPTSRASANTAQTLEQASQQLMQQSGSAKMNELSHVAALMHCSYPIFRSPDNKVEAERCERYFAELVAISMEQQRWELNQNKSVYSQNLVSSVCIAVFVHALTLVGMIATLVELRRAFRKRSVVAEEVSIEGSKVSFKSSLRSLGFYAATCALYALYLLKVYPVQ